MQSGSDTLPQQQKRAFWLRHLHQWHWISSAVCLIAMLLFAATGITLNHSAQIEAHPAVSTKNGHLPFALLKQLQTARDKEEAVLPAEVVDWLAQDLGIKINEQSPEWSPEEAYIALPRPGGDAWLRIALDNGDVEYELTSRGWIAYFNDLHKGRNTGTAWTWFIDIFAASCLIFCITGLFLLKMHARNRPSTWPVVMFGLVLPLVLALVFIH
ncbi:PepSY-associated TM helix domain-containing protein [Undibacterium sp. TS12]|uniref:PepSY-associated TM helix domain-containing protein n=1 Tax=Undibacterium sp. TS12 TaxID=2908202 RepID=UPI001F4CEBA2|nr:PepSY-associated TM helix domain-containing protein [Undibacterium sp. TS12]MCH8617929.1 PepSY-associated TM helix domain-containing protein [Undibacterium sp. TS12]